jgi:hypothetical protein
MVNLLLTLKHITNVSEDMYGGVKKQARWIILSYNRILIT